MPSTIDTSALNEPVRAADVRAFAQQLRADGAAGGRSVVAVIAVTLAAAGIILFAATFFVIANRWAVPPLAGDTVLPWPLVLVVAVFIGSVLVGISRQHRRGQERRYRLHRFAQANGMTYVPRLDTPPLPGMIFQIGRDRRASDVVRACQTRDVEVANYRYTTGSGKEAETHRWGYVALKLPVPLPHIVLDALSNNGLFGASNLPTAFHKEQRLVLEGEFDRHFALYCPTGYERDAHFLFSPDVMARFIDNVAALDVEIVDDWLFLYSRRQFSTLDPATWAWLFSVVEALGEKVDQWARWRDDRLETSSPDSLGPRPALLTPPGVAAEGRRLRRGRSWLGFVTFAVVAAWILTRLF